MSHLHARDQYHFEDVLCTGGGVSHGDVESSVDAERHQTHVVFWLLVIAIIWHINVGENSMEVKTSFLTCGKKINTLLKNYKYKYRRICRRNVTTKVLKFWLITVVILSFDNNNSHLHKECTQTFLKISCNTNNKNPALNYKKNQIFHLFIYMFILLSMTEIL